MARILCLPSTPPFSLIMSKAILVPMLPGTAPAAAKGPVRS